MVTMAVHTAASSPIRSDPVARAAQPATTDQTRTGPRISGAVVARFAAPDQAAEGLHRPAELRCSCLTSRPDRGYVHRILLIAPPTGSAGTGPERVPEMRRRAAAAGQAHPCVAAAPPGTAPAAGHREAKERGRGAGGLFAGLAMSDYQHALTWYKRRRRCGSSLSSGTSTSCSCPNARVMLFTASLVSYAILSKYGRFGWRCRTGA